MSLLQFLCKRSISGFYLSLSLSHFSDKYPKLVNTYLIAPSTYRIIYINTQSTPPVGDETQFQVDLMFFPSVIKGIIENTGIELLLLSKKKKHLEKKVGSQL